MKNFVYALGRTVDPTKGGGMKETIMFIVTIVAIVILEISGIEVNPLLYAVLGANGGMMIGANRRSEEREVSND